MGEKKRGGSVATHVCNYIYGRFGIGDTHHLDFLQQSVNTTSTPIMSSTKCFLVLSAAVLIALIVVLDQASETSAEPGHHGHGHHKGADGTACIVKGSYCSCHYCKCEHGHVWCGHKHHGGKFMMKIIEECTGRFC